MRRIFSRLLRQLLPPACPLCGLTFPAKWAAQFCGACLVDFVPLPAAHCSCCALPFTATYNSPHLCSRCIERPPPFSKIYSFGCYQGKLREAIHQFKFNRQINLDRPLALLLSRELSEKQSFDLIVPVPLHRRRLQQRTYNQSLLLAREMGRLLGQPVSSELLVKKIETPAQHDLSAKQRERNLGKAFQVVQPLRGERILLIDDVVTTGSTARACSQALINAGAADVQVAILARA